VKKSLQLPSGYHELLQELKGRIRTAQVRAGLAVSRELVLLYWSIGRDNGKRGIVRFGQFGNGPLPNWNLNTHRPDDTFRSSAVGLV
jgi:hypothetical protein